MIPLKKIKKYPLCIDNKNFDIMPLIKLETECMYIQKFERSGDEMYFHTVETISMFTDNNNIIDKGIKKGYLNIHNVFEKEKIDLEPILTRLRETIEIALATGGMYLNVAGGEGDDGENVQSYDEVLIIAGRMISSNRINKLIAQATKCLELFARRCDKAGERSISDDAKESITIIVQLNEILGHTGLRMIDDAQQNKKTVNLHSKLWKNNRLGIRGFLYGRIHNDSEIIKVSEAEQDKDNLDNWEKMLVCQEKIDFDSFKYCAMEYKAEVRMLGETFNKMELSENLLKLSVESIGGEIERNIEEHVAGEDWHAIFVHVKQFHDMIDKYSGYSMSCAKNLSTILDKMDTMIKINCNKVQCSLPTEDKIKFKGFLQKDIQNIQLIKKNSILLQNNTEEVSAHLAEMKNWISYCMVGWMLGSSMGTSDEANGIILSEYRIFEHLKEVGWKKISAIKERICNLCAFKEETKLAIDRQRMGIIRVAKEKSKNVQGESLNLGLPKKRSGPFLVTVQKMEKMKAINIH